MPPEMLSLLTTLSLIIRNHVSCAWLSKSDETQTVNDGYQKLSAALESCPELDFRVLPDSLAINEYKASDPNQELRDLIAQLSLIGVHAFVISRGISSQHFAGLMELLAARPHELETLGGLPKVLEQFNIEKVRVKRLIFHEVDEEAQAKALRNDGAATADHAEAALEQAMRILRDTSGGDAGAAAALNEAMRRPEILAEAILRVAAERAGAQAAPPDRAAGVADSMRDACDRLMQEPAAQTQKGKQQIRRGLKQLEQALLSRLDDLPEGESAALRQAITASAEELQENLQVDEIAADFLRKRGAVQSSEERLLKFIRRRGLDRLASGLLRQRLENDGLGAADWDLLLHRSGLHQSSGAGAPGQTELAGFDERLRSAVAGAGADAGAELTVTLAELDATLGALIGKAVARLNELKTAPRAARHVLSGRKLLILGEIVQELCQPLSVMRSCLFMVSGNRMGDLNPQQSAMLKTIADGTDRIARLVDSLREISFTPDKLTPDEDIVRTLYKSDSSS